MSDTPTGTKKNNTHRGEVVRNYVDKTKVKLTELADKIGRSRTSLYRDFENPEMEWKYILRIGAIIGHDFESDFPELSIHTESFLREEASTYSAKDDVLDRAVREIDKWKTKAYENLSEANKWKDLYYEVAMATGKIVKAS